MGSSRTRRRNAFVGLWLLPTEKTALEKTAKQLGTTVGALIRAAALEGRNSILQTEKGHVPTESRPPRRTAENDATSFAQGEGDLTGEGDYVKPDKTVAQAVFRSARGELASEIGMIALAQVCYQLFECRLVLEALPHEVDLNFDGVVQSVASAQQLIRQAYSAASLLSKGGELRPSSGSGHLRPEEVFARHGAAVSAGAQKVVPDISPVDRFSDGLTQSRNKDRSRDFAGPRPTCKATLRNGSRRCTKSALYLGHGQWAPTCYIHATAQDRIRFRANEHHPTATAVDTEVMVVFGQAVMFAWADASVNASWKLTLCGSRKSDPRRIAERRTEVNGRHSPWISFEGPWSRT